MAFLKNLFKPKWQHNDAEVRRQALTGLAQEQLLEFIAVEADSGLRQQAISRLDQSAQLQPLMNDSRADVRDAARQRWLQLLLPDAKALSSITDSATLAQIAALTDDEQQRLDAINAISDQQQRLDIATSNPVAKVRLCAAQGIDQPELLQQLLQHSQGKDKAVYRLCKDRLHDLKAQQQAKQAQQEKIQQLADNVSQLNRLGYNPEFNGRFQVLTKQWQSFTADAAISIDGELNSAIEQGLNQAQATLQQHADLEAAQAAKQAAEQSAANEQQLQLNALTLLLENAKDAAAEPFQQQLTAIANAWHQAVAVAKASPEQHKAFENGYQQALNIATALAHLSAEQEKLNSWLAAHKPEHVDGQKDVNKDANKDINIATLKTSLKQAQQWQRTLHWPAGVDAPGWVGQIEQVAKQAQQQLDKLAGEQQNRLQTIDQQIAKLEVALDEGHVKDASKLHQQLSQNLRQVDNKLAASQQRQARSLGARLQEMRDWQGFATTPKKQALCEQMEALIDADISADVLADKIHQLQEQWKGLNSGQNDKALWSRFQAAGDKAFEPCRAYFAEQAQQREQFVAQRNALTAELISYEQQLDWNNADWKVVQKTLDAAREAFRSFSPVERGAHKTTQQAFQQACDAIYQHLQQEYDANLAAKQVLVEQAGAQVDAEQLSDAIDAVKALQQQWKTIGITPRHLDQKLWKQFRAHCDAVFARLDSEKAERKAEINQAVDQATALVEQAEALFVADADSELNQQSQQLAQLREQFNAIELPKSAHQRLVKRLQQCDGQLNDARDAAAQAKERARWQGLIDRLSAIANQDQELWAQAGDLPQGYNSELFEQAFAGDQKQEQDNQQAALEQCISMEIFADVESPEQDKALRMQLQVQRLAQGIGNPSQQQRQQQRQQLVEQWLPHARSAQSQRFINALSASF